MRPRPLLLHEARVAFGLNAALPMMLLPGFAAIQWWLWTQDDVTPRLIQLIRAFELILPLAAALASAHLMAIEREEGFHELRRSYPEHPWRLPLLRTGGALLLTLLTLAAGAALFRLGYGPYPVDETILPALAPTLFLLGVSLLVGNLTASYWVAAGTAMGWWFLEILTRGGYTGLLFLFNETWPLDEVDPLANRWWLAALGLALLGINAWLKARRPI